VTGESHLPRKLIVLNLSGSWKQVWTGPFSLPQLESYSINPGQITDLGSALQQAQQSPCLAGLNLSNNRLTTVPAGMTSWNYVTRTLSLSGNSICTVSHGDSTWITAAEKSSSLNHFWPQTCPGP
jgi:Leucine-rich repeat (LRR) protein